MWLQPNFRLETRRHRKVSHLDQFSSGTFSSNHNCKQAFHMRTVRSTFLDITLVKRELRLKSKEWKAIFEHSYVRHRYFASVVIATSTLHTVHCLFRMQVSWSQYFKRLFLTIVKEKYLFSWVIIQVLQLEFIWSINNNSGKKTCTRTTCIQMLCCSAVKKYFLWVVLLVIDAIHIK